MSWKPRVTFAYVAYFSGVGASFPYLPVFFLSLGLSLDAVGAIAALQAATQLLAAPVWGGLADRFPRSRFTHPPLALLAAGGAAILVVAGGIEGALIGAVVLAAGIAGTGPVLDARVLELLGPERGRFGSFRAWGSAAFVVSATLVGIALDRLGARAMFAIYLPALLLTTAAIVSLPSRPVTRSVSILRGASSIVTAPRMGLFLGGVFLVLVSLTAVNAFYSIRIVTLGGGDALVGLTWAIGAMVEVPVMLGFSRLARRFGTERLIVVGSLALAIRAGGAAVTGDPSRAARHPDAGGLRLRLLLRRRGHLPRRARAGRPRRHRPGAVRGGRRPRHGRRVGPRRPRRRATRDLRPVRGRGGPRPRLGRRHRHRPAGRDHRRGGVTRPLRRVRTERQRVLLTRRSVSETRRPARPPWRRRGCGRCRGARRRAP